MNKTDNCAELRTYSHPFSFSYWVDSAREFKNLRVIAAAALLVALQIVMKVFFIPLPVVDRRVYFTFLPTAVCSMIGGPLIALATGFISDIIGYIIAPSGAFYFGYTISSMAGSLIYAVLLYRAKPSFIRLALSKTFVNLFVNTLLGAVWLNILIGKGYIYYVTTGGIKNLILLPFEIIILVMFLHTLSPALRRLGLIRDAGSFVLTKRYIAVAVGTTLICALGIGIYIWNYISPAAGTALTCAAIMGIK